MKKDNFFVIFTYFKLVLGLLYGVIFATIKKDFFFCLANNDFINLGLFVKSVLLGSISPTFYRQLLVDLLV